MRQPACRYNLLNSRRRRQLRPRLRWRDDRGASAIELAVIAPSLLMLVFFVIQTGLWFYGRSVAVQSAREGVSELRLAQDEAAYLAMRDGVNQHVQDFAVQVGRESLIRPTVTTTYEDTAARVSVSVTGHAISLLPFLTLTIRESASGSVERFQ
jgi:Flp pilus assembly protein TadG